MMRANDALEIIASTLAISVPTLRKTFAEEAADAWATANLQRRARGLLARVVTVVRGE